MFQVKNKVMIRFFHEKEELFKMCYSQCVAWYPSFLVGSSTQIVSGRHRFNSYQSLIFFHFCNCLNCVSPWIALLYFLFVRSTWSLLVLPSEGRVHLLQTCCIPSHQFLSLLCLFINPTNKRKYGTKWSKMWLFVPCKKLEITMVKVNFHQMNIMLGLLLCLSVTVPIWNEM